MRPGLNTPDMILNSMVFESGEERVRFSGSKWRKPRFSDPVPASLRAQKILEGLWWVGVVLKESNSVPGPLIVCSVRAAQETEEAAGVILIQMRRFLGLSLQPDQLPHDERKILQDDSPPTHAT